CSRNDRDRKQQEWRAWAVRPMKGRNHHGADAPRSPGMNARRTPMLIDIDCLDHERLRGLIDGSLTGAEEQRCRAHLDGCPTCQRRLEERAGLPWSIVQRLRASRPETTEPALVRVMEVLKADGPEGEESSPLDFLEPSAEPDHLGRLGPYEVLEVLGQGGMGVVLKGFDEALQRPVAIKLLAPVLAVSGAARKRFAREARAAAAISHEHVVPIFAVDTCNGLPYLVMPFIPGLSLQERLERDGPLELEEILSIGLQTASALAAAHAEGLIHRDVKPANILLENGVERVRLCDFGLARALDDAGLTQSGMLPGTPAYMAPEQARGEPLDARADLFSLGSVLYAMCTGRSPF